MGGTTLVLYHADCPDGFGAAFAAWRALGDAAAYLPVRHGEPPPPQAEDGPEVLYLLDFAYPRATMEHLASLAGSVRVLDHHATAAEDLAGLPYATIDLDKSGAVLAWEHFHPGRPIPLLLRYVQDRDLWRWELGHSRELNAALALVPHDFAAWDRLARELDGDDVGRLEELFRTGTTVLAYRTLQVGRLCDRAFWTDVAGHRVPVVNSPGFASEIGEELCRRHPEAPFAAVFSLLSASEETWSLRSRGGFDVSRVARSLGGGGHRAAAGFRIARRGSEGEGRSIESGGTRSSG